MAMRKLITRRIVIWILLIISLLALIRLVPNLTQPNVIPADDYVRFWAGAKLVLAGDNPYDPSSIDRLQVEAGGQGTSTGITSIVLNPPWALSLLLPFGLLSYPLSRLVWLLLTIILLIICTQILWGFYQGSAGQKWIGWIAVFIFAPTISVLEKGQITPFLLLSLVGFLYFAVYRRNDLAAGAFLTLASIKPQVMYIVWIAVLVWVIRERRWLILAGLGGTILLLTVLTMIFDASIVQQYLTAMRTYQTAEWATPTFGSYLRYFWLGTGSMWPQFLPVAVGIIWFIYYWIRHASRWNWLEALPVILLVSILTTPYAWTYDHVILVPAVVQAVIWLHRDTKKRPAIWLAMCFLGISLLDLGLHIKLNDFWFIWLAPAIVIWYFLVNKQRAIPRVEVRV